MSASSPHSADDAPSGPPSNGAVDPENATDVKQIPEATVLFAGDSGDGMQLTGLKFTMAAAHAQNDLATLPDYPAEIRAPAGTTYGVSGFQLHFGSVDIHTPGDKVDLFVAMNAAALKVHLHRVRPGGTVVVNVDSFGERDLNLAELDANPLDDLAVVEDEGATLHLTGNLWKKIDFPYATQVFLLRRTREKNGERSEEVVCGITSRDEDHASEHDLLALNRGHWAIENKLHLPRDTTYKEDGSRIRKHKGARSIASLKNLAIGLHALGVFCPPSPKRETIPKMNRRIARNPQIAVKFCITPCNKNLLQNTE